MQAFGKSRPYMYMYMSLYVYMMYCSITIHACTCTSYCYMYIHRYSARVDPYISTISMCLKDSSLLIRKQTITLLSQLLQQDYIKWKGSLFFHFIATLVDEEVRELTEFCMLHLFLIRNPTIFYVHFVECVFHFNDYRKHNGK